MIKLKLTEKDIEKELQKLFPYEYHSRGMMGGYEYYMEKTNHNSQFTQLIAAEKWKVSTVTIRKHYQKILEKKHDE